MKGAQAGRGPSAEPRGRKDLGVKPRVRPRLSGHLAQAQFPRDDLLDDALLSELSVVDADFAGRTAHLVDVEGCRLTGSKLASSRLDKLTVSDSVLDRCDLANVELSHGAMSRVEMTACRLTGLAASGAVWRQVLVKDCLADMSSFRFAAFTRVEFADCRLQGADFVGADLSDTLFRRCDLTRVELSQVKAVGTAFIDCTWDGIGGVTSLSGATIAHSSPTDALTFTAAMATALRITLGDPDDFPED